MYRAQNLRPGADHNVISNCSGGLIRPLCHCDLLKDGYILSKTGVVGNNDPIQMEEQDRRRGKLRPRAQIRVPIEALANASARLMRYRYHRRVN